MQKLFLVALATIAFALFAPKSASAQNGCPRFTQEMKCWQDSGFVQHTALIGQSIDLAGLQEMCLYRASETLMNIDSFTAVTSACWDSIEFYSKVLSTNGDSTIKGEITIIKESGVQDTSTAVVANTNQLSQRLANTKANVALGKQLTDQFIQLSAEFASLKDEHIKAEAEKDSLNGVIKTLHGAIDSAQTEIRQLNDQKIVLDSMKRANFSTFLYSDSLAFQEFIALLDTVKVLRQTGKLAESCRQEILYANSEAVTNTDEFNTAMKNFWHQFHHDANGMLMTFIYTLDGMELTSSCAGTIEQILQAGLESTTDNLIKEIDNFWLCVKKGE